MDRASQHTAERGGTTPDPPEDADTLDRLRAGDASAFEALVSRHGARLLCVTRRLLHNEEDARDALQDAFLAAFRGMDSFAGSSRLSTWLHRIAVNAALAKLRKKKRAHEVAIDDLMPRFLADGHQADPAVSWRKHNGETSEAERAETRALVRRLIDKLPEDFRTVIVLRDIEELDTQETAELLQLSEGTVKVRLHRARQALRQLLDPYQREGVA